MRHVTKVQYLGGHRLWLRFDDGVEGELDLSKHLTFDGVFAPHRDPEFFAKVTLDDFGTVSWPNDTDWDPLVLYALVTGQDAATLFQTPEPHKLRKK